MSLGSTTLPGELERTLLRAELSCLLVPPRILRRVIKKDRGLTGVGLQVPHYKSYVLSRDALLAIATRAELEIAEDRPLPDTVLLLPQPDGPLVAGPKRDALLLKYWRLLFHAGVHRQLGRCAAEGRLTDADVRDRVHAIGEAEFDEVRAVLRQEFFLLPPADDRTAYEEFAALYLELRFFAPYLLRRYFPAVNDFAAVDRLLAADVDGEALFEQTRLDGAPDPAQPLDQESEEADRALAGLMRAAEKVGLRGNVVRAAILNMRAVWAARLERADEPRHAAHEEVKRLTYRLQAAIGFSDEDLAAWRETLMELLEPASRTIWPVEARLLYDLQRVCVDRERDIYAVDLIEWAISLGRRPVMRVLPHQPFVLIVKHLRSAARRLTAARLLEVTRQRLGHLLAVSLHHCEEELRNHFRPLVRDILHEVGLQPANVPERLAEEKLIEELLDRIVERGYIAMGDLRDAVARNRLKLPDLGNKVPAAAGAPSVPARAGVLGFLGGQLAGVRDFFFGDPLIRANRRLGASMEGVYRRGDVYLRWLQRFSAASFGTRLGRLLILYLVLPFGGAYLLLEGAQHMVDQTVHFFAPPPLTTPEELAGSIGQLSDPASGPLMVAASHAAVHAYHVHFVHPYTLIPLGLLLAVILHVGALRNRMGRAFLTAWHLLRSLVFDVPAYVLNLPPIRFVLQSRLYLLAYRFVLKPLLWATPVPLALYWLGYDHTSLALLEGSLFVLLCVLLNSRLGLHFEEACTDRLVRTWEIVRINVVPETIRLILYVFKRTLEEIERFLYTVDEWFRFRRGDSRLSLLFKPVLGVLWYVFTYVVRLTINLFIEPTYNPIKHFPVVTVAAKLMIPIIPLLDQLVTGSLEPVVGLAAARLALGVVLFFLPGLAGFLVWELKENWRLYRANQSPTLVPEVVGHHGETVLRLMRPGIHSGTLPKLYARLRHSARANESAKARKQMEALHQIEEALRHFVSRDLLAILDGSHSWRLAGRVQAGEILTGTNRLRIELRCPELGKAGVQLDFEEHGGWLVAAVGQPGWLLQLEPEQARAFTNALAGFYKLAGVDLVREQLAAVLPAGATFAVDEDGLTVWPDREGKAVYDLDGSVLQPQPPLVDLPGLTAAQVLFSANPIYWDDWIEVWEHDRAGKGHPVALVRGQRLLPDVGTELTAIRPVEIAVG